MDEKTIKKGSLINALGIVGKALLPLLFVVITRLFGPKIMGIFFMAFVFLDIAFNFTMSGVKDGVALFTARNTNFNEKTDSENRDFYRILANAAVLLGLISVFSILLFLALGKAIIISRYPDGKLYDALLIMVWTIPLYALPNLVVSAIRGLLLMHWEVILINFMRPLLMCLAAVIVYFGGWSLQGLAWGYLISNIILFIISIFIFEKYFSFTSLIKGLHRPFWERKLLTFIIPQNLNSTFNTLITNIDIMMLGFFKTDPVLIGYYGMGAQIVRNIRQIKIAMAGIMGPVITRLHALGNIKEIERLFNKTTRWALTLAIPSIFLVGMFRNELLQIFHKSFTGEANFMLLLLLPPLMSCMMGMAGDIIVMTGHSAWNLINSISIAILSLVLNYFLIPVWNLEGAALSTAISTFIVYFLQLFVVHHLFSVHLKKSGLRPLLYVPLPAVIFLVLHWAGLTGNALNRILIAAISVGSFLVLYKFDKKRSGDESASPMP